MWLDSWKKSAQALWRNKLFLQSGELFFNNLFEEIGEVVIWSTEDEVCTALHQGLEGIGDAPPIQSNLLIGPHDIGAGSLDLVGQALGSEEVSHGVGLKSFYLDQALFDQPLHQDVDAPQRDPDVLTEFSLGSIRVLVDVGENGEFLCGFVKNHVYNVQFLNLTGSSEREKRISSSKNRVC